MELKDYLVILWTRRWVVFTTTIVTLAVVAAGTYTTSPVYSATAIIRVASSTIAADSYSDYIYSERLLNTYARIATSLPVLEELSERLNMEQAPFVQVEILPNTELLEISVEDKDPRLSAEAANALAAQLVDLGKTLYSGGRKSAKAILAEQLVLAKDDLLQERSKLEKLLKESPENSQAVTDSRESLEVQQDILRALLEQYEQASIRDAIRENMISIVEPAIPPIVPVRPRPILNLICGMILGLTGGVGLAFLLYYLKGEHTAGKKVEPDLTIHAP